eukprot:m.7537 g.7537  ORF g.7537 m.7537 type:complete len:378 (+) comp4781_c0_seq2:442-1575(+)
MPPVSIVVQTAEHQQQHEIDSKTTGEQLKLMVLKEMGLSQVPLYGLQFEDSKGYLTFVKMHKKVLAHDLKKNAQLSFSFTAQFFPESVNEELNHPTIQRLFWLQIRAAIVADEIYCPPELCVLFAGLALQAMHGDSTPDKVIIPDKELPKRVLDQHGFSLEQWSERILTAWKLQAALPKEQAVMDYLNVAQDLEMYGVTYFEVTNKKGTKLWLGVHNLGMDVYEYSNKVTPRLGFPWVEIRNIRFDNKKFTIKMVAKDAPSFKFYAPRFQINKRILALCVGNHKFYLSRREAQRAGRGFQEDRVAIETKIKRVKEQLLAIRGDLEKVKDKSKATQEDLMYEKQHTNGMDKFATMKRAQAGDLKRRVMEFNDLVDSEA